MLNPSLWFLPKVSLRDRASLPERPGIYYACDRGGTIRYVGMSNNLRRRWTAKGDREHHKLKELEGINGVFLKYRLVPEHRLEYEEALDIQRFQPDLNHSFPNPEAHQSVRIKVENFFVGVGGFGVAAIAVAFLFSGFVLQQRSVDCPNNICSLKPGK